MLNIVADLQLPPVDERECLRYAGVRGEADEGSKTLFAECLKEGLPLLSPKACYRILGREAFFSLVSGARESALAQAAIGESERVALFAVTLGLQIDRLLAKYARLSPAKALFLQGLGAERVESACDCLEKELNERGICLQRRFSPGYGDFPLTAQREIFSLLNCPKLIGLTLTDGLVMSPSKSVTAAAGITRSSARSAGCAECLKKDCEYRK